MSSNESTGEYLPRTSHPPPPPDGAPPVDEAPNDGPDDVAGGGRGAGRYPGIGGGGYAAGSARVVYPLVALPEVVDRQEAERGARASGGGCDYNSLLRCFTAI